MAIIILEQIISMLIIMLIGVVCYKKKLITEKGNKEVSSILLMVVNPLVILMSFQRAFEVELLKNFIYIMLLSAATYVIMIPITNLLIPKKNKEYAIERFASIYSNCGFFGIPLINITFGLEGVFYLTAYLMVFNILVWTHGIYLMQGSSLSLKQAMKDFMNPNIYCVIIGFLMFILNISFPKQLFDGLSYVSGMNTPLAMLIAGVSLAQADLKYIVKQKRLYYVSAVRLIILPIIILLFCKLLPMPDMLVSIIIIVSACPVAATGTLLALRFEKNSAYASAIYVLTTILAVVTMPLIMIFL